MVHILNTNFAHSTKLKPLCKMVLPNCKEVIFMAKSLFEQVGGTYEKQGDYLT